jgi:hypothetical protein
MSYNNRAYGLYYTYRPDILDFGRIELGLKLGGMYGYKDTVEDLLIVPIIAPTMQVNIYKGLSGELSMNYVHGGAVFLFNFKLDFMQWL